MEDVEESIYNLVPLPLDDGHKLLRYNSKFKPTVLEEIKKYKSPNKTMGPAKVEVKTPENFLKKGFNKFVLKDRINRNACKEKKYLNSSENKPPVPKLDEKPLMGIRTNKNFITTNAVENIMSVAKKPQPKYVDTRIGDNRLLDPSGLVPKYIKKSDYGTVPGYLVKRNEEVKLAQEEYDAYILERMRQGSMQQLSNEEREEMIDGLKQNWEELHHHYQGLSVVTDTAPKKNRKERMEAEMKQIERDIDLIERHKVIYIRNN